MVKNAHSLHLNFNFVNNDRKQVLNVPNQVYVLGPIGKQDGLPGLWLAGEFLTSSLKPLNKVVSIFGVVFGIYPDLLLSNILPMENYVSHTYETKIIRPRRFFL